MSQRQPQPDQRTPSGLLARSPWVDGPLAALVGVGYGLALFNSPTTWLVAVMLLILAAGWYAYLFLRFVRLGDRRPDQAAQRAHGVRLIVLFALAYLLARLTPPPDWRVLYAVGGGLLVCLGGFVVLRWEARTRGKATLSEADDRIGT